MKPEVEELIEIYGNKEKYQQRITDLSRNTDLSKDKLSDLLEKDDIKSKIDFGKNRQRAEILKQNDDFLKELSGIKNRLGEKFFRLMEEVISEGPFKWREGFLTAGKDLLLKYDFAKPKVIISHSFLSEHENYPSEVFYLPGTPIESDDWPESTVYEKDSYFDGLPLEWVVVPEHELTFNIKIDDPKFMFRCKEKLFKNYLDKWKKFLTKWHISTNWNGELDKLHAYSLPSVIVERDDKNHNMPVIIHLGAWATREDVKEAWTTVEEIMKEARIFRERESEDKIFIRDLIWFRMNKEDATSPSKIAHFWAGKFPKEIDLEVIEKVTRHEDTFEKVPLEERLEEVLSEDPKMAELRGKFIEARKAFIRIGLKDKVKKSIKKTEKKIKRLGSENWDRNRIKVFHRGEPFQKKGEK